MSTTAIRNFIAINDRIATAGQPTKEQFEAAREEGYEVVINLVPSTADNAMAGEDALVRSLGMEYHGISVIWTNPQPTDFTTFCDIMKNAAGKKVLIHCAMNYRVTAFFSSYALKHLGWSTEQADALVARGWGFLPDYEMNETWQSFIAAIRQ